MILDSSGDNFVVSADAAGGRQYESLPLWMARHWEAGATDRLNEAHWSLTEASNVPINDWLSESLGTIRSRATYEVRQNGDLAGMVGTLIDDVVGPDGPTLEVQSDNNAYNDEAEATWKGWFKSPTFDRTLSGAALLRMWVGNLPKCGEFLAEIATDPTADGPVKMRLRPKHPRDLQSPVDLTGDARMVLGVEYETTELDRPARYWLAKYTANGYTTEVEPWPADLVIHEFISEEEKQARGYPWFTSSLSSAADLRDYDDQIQDAARLMADQACLLYTTDASEPWGTPESTEFERRTIKMVPPGWQPFTQNAALPPVQYPDYVAARQRKIARPIRMPLMIAQADASRHNYSSARFDSQGWARFVQFVQFWLSGSDKSYGVLNRLVDLVLAEARFSSPTLRTAPAKVSYEWTWPVRPHVDPLKEAAASEKDLVNRVSSLTEELAARGKSLDTHIATLKREQEKLEAAGIPLPAYMTGGGSTVDVDPEDDEEDASNSKQGAKANG